MNINPSRHVPRSHRVRFEGSPKSGKILVRCPSEMDFTMLLGNSVWRVVLGSGFARSVHPGICPHSNPYLVYLQAVKVLWNMG